jgi:DNA (cytosine-5)-methyltransferase 1
MVSRGGVMYTLNSTEIHSVCYRIGSYHSNSMKSDNPHSGIYEAKVCNTLDNMNCGYPACNQGGVVVVEIHQSGISSGRQQSQDSGR